MYVGIDRLRAKENHVIAITQLWRRNRAARPSIQRRPPRMRSTIAARTMTTSGVVLLVFDVVLSWPAALIAASLTFVSLIALWAGTPWLATRNANGNSVGKTAL